MTPHDVTVAVVHASDPPVPEVDPLEAVDPVEEVTVARASEAGERIERPDLVLAIAEEGPDPIETVDDRFPERPVLALTAGGVDPAEAIEAGATDVLRRETVERAVLSRRIEILLERRRSERRLDAVLESTAAAICLLAPDGTVERANGTARSRVEGSIAGRPFWELP